MDKSLLEVFSGVKNALIAGVVWLTALYLILALLDPRWVDPMAGAAAPLRVVVDALGSAGLTAVALLVMALLGDGMIRTWGWIWSKFHRATLMYVLEEVSDASSARVALQSLSWLGHLTRTFSNRALLRLIEEYERQRKACDLAAATSQDVRALASNVVFMAPLLLTLSDRSFAEQQRHMSRVELGATLVLGLPLLIGALTVNLTADWALLAAGFLVAALVGVYVWIQTAVSWIDGNSQIAHILVDQKHSIELSSQNRGVSRGPELTLPRWYGRWIKRRPFGGGSMV